jgi:hypothetical protein
MVKWEYCVLIASERPYRVATSVKGETKSLEFYESVTPLDCMQALGDEGWELVASRELDRGSEYFFKRPKVSTRRSKRGEGASVVEVSDVGPGSTYDPETGVVNGSTNGRRR